MMAEVRIVVILMDKRKKRRGLGEGTGGKPMIYHHIGFLV